MHFKEAWINELHISSNTFYIGDTPVLCADNDAVSIRADPGQGITLTTTSDGETSLVSAKGVDVVSEGGVTMRVSGPLGRVNIQSSGAGGTVNLGAEKEIVMTAPLTTISSNMIVKGDLTVEGTQLTTSVDNVSLFSVGDVVMYSDIRTKSDVLPIPDALERVGRLRGYTFIKNGDETRRSCGLIAQELLDVLPEAVHAHPESGMLTVAYGNVVSLLVNAINELKAQVDTLSCT
eukprot:gene32870-biopygen13913